VLSDVAGCRVRRGVPSGETCGSSRRGELRVPGRSSNDARVHLEGPRWKEFGLVYYDHLELTDLLLCAVSSFGRLVDSVARPVL
jgi:hypothetical protein